MSDASHEAQPVGAVLTSPLTPDEQAALLEPFGLGKNQTETALRAFEDAPKGTPIVVRESRAYGLSRGNSGGALLIFRLRRGDHLAIDFATDAPRPITGFRRVRGSHGESTIEHPEGTDPPP